MIFPELIESARELKMALKGPAPRSSWRSRLPNLVPGISLAIGVGCLVFFSGCAVGPNYKRPTVDSPGSFRNAPVAVTTNSFADLPWWDVYQDETLKSLIYTSLTNNFDVRIAAARVEQARAISLQARSQFFPSVGYGGGVSRGRNEFLGRNPGPVARNTTLLEQSMPPEVPAGLPSALLERRPDIRAAEQSLRSANAQVGVSVAEFFPRIGLTALLGKVSPEVSAFTAGSANMWSIAANATGPLFQGGALRAQYRGARAFWEQVKLEYEQRVLAAFQEVSDALVSRDKYALARVQFDKAVTAYQEAVEVSMQRYLSGNASYFEVLEAQQLLFPAEISLARAEANQLLVIIQLYRSLGGGWNLDNPTFISGE